MAAYRSNPRQPSWCTSWSNRNILCLAILMLSILSGVSSFEMEIPEDVQNSVLFRRLAAAGQIHVDTRAPPAIHLVEFEKRDNSSSAVSSVSTASATKATRISSVSVSSATSLVSSTANSTVTSTSASSSVVSKTTTEVSLTALPTPFDTSLGNNFTVQSCPTFFNTFINNATFKSCLPVSLLLQNSMGFFRATRSASSLDTVLDASCRASLVICSPLMSSLAESLISDANCGADYKKQNPLVMQAYSGLLAYEPLYNATCLENKDTGNYCFSDAVVNATNAADLYPYYTALGIPLPVTAQPSCNSCLQQTMNVFAGYAKNKDQPLSRTYIACATQVDATCGSSFAKTDVKIAVDTSKNSGSRSRSSTATIGLTAIVLSWVLTT